MSIHPASAHPHPSDGLNGSGISGIEVSGVFGKFGYNTAAYAVSAPSTDDED